MENKKIQRTTPAGMPQMNHEGKSYSNTPLLEKRSFYLTLFLCVLAFVLFVPKPYDGHHQTTLSYADSSGDVEVRSKKCFGASIQFRGGTQSLHGLNAEQDNRRFTHVCFGVPWSVTDDRNVFDQDYLSVE